MRPTEIRRVEGSHLEFSFKEAESRRVSLGDLRKSCACAVCRESKVPLNESMPFFPRATSLNKIEPVGNYAMAITWGDGHRSIYAFERLFEAAPEMSA